MVWALYANEPNWGSASEWISCASLMKAQSIPIKHAEAKFFIAEDNGAPSEELPLSSITRTTKS